MGTVQYSIPILSLGGRIGDSQMVFYSARGKPLVRAFKQPANPSTADQTAVRAFLIAAARQWALLTEPQRVQWNLYAETYFGGDGEAAGDALNGPQVYNKVAFFRQALGLALPAAAPAAGPPSPVSRIIMSVVSSETEFTFGVEHAIAPVTGMKLMTRITPAVPPGRTPRKTQLRFIKGVGPDSFVDLPASGSDATYTGAQFAIPNGTQFRIELTILSPDAVPSLATAETFGRAIL
jgi:hypothetical protein